MGPAESIVDAATRPIAVTDTKGRNILARRLMALDTLRLLKAAGPVLAHNEPWLSVASLAFSVLEVDGVPIPTPTSEAQIESVVAKLGDEGLSAVAAAIEPAPNNLAAPSHVGNLLGTQS